MLRSGEKRPATPGNKIYTLLMTFIRFSLYICPKSISYINPNVAVLGVVKKIFSRYSLALRKANYWPIINKPFAVVSALHSVLFHFTHQMTSGYSISLIRDPARGTSQL